MNSILEDLYFGNIAPNTTCFAEDSDYAKAKEIVAGCGEKLCATLEGTDKTRFLDYVNAWEQVHSATVVEKFAIGFRLGARLMAEAFQNDCGGAAS